MYFSNLRYCSLLHSNPVSIRPICFFKTLVPNLESLPQLVPIFAVSCTPTRWNSYLFQKFGSSSVSVSGVCLMAEPGGPRLYSCYNCRNHVSLHDDIISKAFQGRNGRAFLFSHAMNIVAGPKEDRQLTTGLHTVADIHCADCQKVLGWKYVRAYESSQKYKEGKFILEKSKIVKENW